MKHVCAKIRIVMGLKRTRLEQARDDAGLTKAELARRAGVSYKLVESLENGERGKRISHDAAVRISAALDLPTSELFPVEITK